MPLAERLCATVDKIANNVKPDQIHYGATVLVVDLGNDAQILFTHAGRFDGFF